MTPIPILRIGVLARQFCRDHARANVEAVFERSFYLRAGDDFICVGAPDIGNGPLTLIAGVDRWPDLKPQQPVEVGERQIVIGDSPSFALDHGETWQAPPWPVRPPPGRLIETCLALARRAATEAPTEGLARAVCGVAAARTVPAIRIRIANFERWLSGKLAGQGHGVANDAIGLLGLGPGLTPSGDDVCVGAFAALDAIGEREVHAALARVIVAMAPGATSPLSACLLRAAAAGYAGEGLHRAVSAALAGDADAAIAAADEIGHSSGWDMLAGAIMALQAAAHVSLRSSLLPGGKPPG